MCNKNLNFCFIIVSEIENEFSCSVLKQLAIKELKFGRGWMILNDDNDGDAIDEDNGTIQSSCILGYVGDNSQV